MKCQDCETVILAIEAEVDPRDVTLRFRAQCGHPISPAATRSLWQQGMRWALPVVDGSSLVAAERWRQVHEEGYTPEHDATHDPTDLPWAAWSLLDAATVEGSATSPPTMWPWDPESWKPEHTPMRRLIIAGALIAAEIDRRLMEQRSQS